MLSNFTCLRSAMLRHALIPAGLGSGKTTLVYKLHALLHHLCVGVGSWEGVAKSFSMAVPICTDQGTERLFGQVEASIDELREWGYLPELGVAGFPSGTHQIGYAGGCSPQSWWPGSCRQCVQVA